MSNILRIPTSFIKTINKIDANAFNNWVTEMKLSRINNTHGFDSDEKQIEILQRRFNENDAYSEIIKDSFNWQTTENTLYWRDLYFMLYAKGL